MKKITAEEATEDLCIYIVWNHSIYNVMKTKGIYFAKRITGEVDCPTLNGIHSSLINLLKAAEVLPDFKGIYAINSNYESESFCLKELDILIRNVIGGSHETDEMG